MKKISINPEENSLLASFEEYFKKVRGTSDITSLDPEPSNLNLLLRKFSKYSQIELIATLSGLQLDPENHSQVLRLGAAVRVSCSNITNGKKDIERRELKKILNKCLPIFGDIGVFEDPPETAFTENIVYHGGNYTVYTAYSEKDNAILRCLLNTIHKNKPSFLQDFVRLVETSTFALLTLSNMIAVRLGHYRNMDSPDNWRGNIILPDIIQIKKLGDSTIISDDEIDLYLKSTGINHTIFTPFFSRVGDNSFSEQDINWNPLFIRPLVKIDDKIIFALPSYITCAITHHIFSLAQRFEVFDLLLREYAETIWERVKEDLILMLFKQTKIHLPPIEGNLLIKDDIYQIDSDKFAYVILVTDNGSNYDVRDVNGEWDISQISDTINDRICEIVQLLESNGINKILIMVIFGGIGRSCRFRLNKLWNNVLLVPFDDLDVIAKLRELDNLSLWKYSVAENRLHHTTELFSWGFLDKFALYHLNNDSFSLSDERNPLHLNVVPGTGRKLRLKSGKINDIHAALIGTPPEYIGVIRRFDDENLPIFFRETLLKFPPIEQLIEGYNQAIWVKPNVEKSKNSSCSIFVNTYLGITDLLSYWLWQLMPDLKTHLKVLGSNPIRISYELENESQWVKQIEINNFNQNQEIILKWVIDGYDINIIIPSTIIPYFSKMNNIGDRIIISNLLGAFSELLQSFNKPNTLMKENRDEILAKYAPLGLKKKFSLFDITLHTSLNPVNIPDVRLLQKYNQEEQTGSLEKIFPEILCSITRIEDPKVRSIKICNALVDFYYERLRSKLSQFSYHSLMIKLIGYHEAICHSREKKRLTMPTAIACYYDAEEMQKKEIEEMPNFDATALALRSLIEIIAAEPPRGENELSLDDYDSILAITDRLIQFGMISDHIRHNIVNYSIDLLQSGKVKIIQSPKIWENFYKSKISELIYLNSENYAKFFNNNQDSSNIELDISDEDIAFKAEFGLTLSEIIGFINEVTIEGLHQKQATAHLPLAIFKEMIKERLSWDDQQVECAIKLFSLVPREKWEKPPNGFLEVDIWPWRYNRRLSYLRRPIIISSGPLEEVYWGPRHTEESGKELLALVHSGRYNADASSKEMKKLIGRIVNENGHGFTHEIKKWFESNSDSKWIVDSEVPIRPDKPLHSDIDLGDIDVLVIDRQNQRILSIECKDINFGRNPHEINQEIERFIEDQGSYIQKHKNREEWLKRNITMVIKRYSLNVETLEVISYIITSSEIPAPYLREMPINIISYVQLKQEGIKIFDE